jgi:hypothetical protein
MSKIGDGHATGMARKGLSELAQYLPAFNTAGQGISEDQAIWPNQTPGEIANMRGDNGNGPEQESPKLSLADMRGGVEASTQAAEPEQKMSLDELRAQAADRAKEAEQSMERTPERDGREM